MAGYRPAERRWIPAAGVVGAYLIGVAVLFTMQVGDDVRVTLPFAVAAPPLVYAALSMLLLRGASALRRVSWIGGACLVHLLLGILAAIELSVAGGLPFASALAQVFVLFAPAPALTLLATPVVLAPFVGLFTVAPAPRPRTDTAPARAAAPVTPPSAASPASSTSAGSRPTPFSRPAGVGTRPQGAASMSAGGVKPAVPATALPKAPVSKLAAVAATPTTKPPVSTPATAAVYPLPPPPPPAPVSFAAPSPVSPAKPSPSRPAITAPTDDVMIRISFERVASQLPAEAFVLPFDRLAESLREPHALLVPRRVVLAQMREGAVAIDWPTISSQFPELALGISDSEFRSRYPHLRLTLPADEILEQLPADARPLASAVLSPDALQPLAPPAAPSNGRVPSSAASAPAVISPAPVVPELPTIERSPVPDMAMPVASVAPTPVVVEPSASEAPLEVVPPTPPEPMFAVVDSTALPVLASLPPPPPTVAMIEPTAPPPVDLPPTPSPTLTVVEPVPTPPVDSLPTLSLTLTTVEPEPAPSVDSLPTLPLALTTLEPEPTLPVDSLAMLPLTLAVVEPTPTLAVDSLPEPPPRAAVVAEPPPEPAPVDSSPLVDGDTLATIVEAFAHVGTFEAAAERVDGGTLVALVAPTLPRDKVIACAAHAARFLSGVPGEVVTVRTELAVVVVAGAPTPIVVATPYPGVPVALLELRAARAAATLGPGTATREPWTSNGRLEPLPVDARAAAAARELPSFGAVEATVFSAGAVRVYVLRGAGREAAPLAALAAAVCEALRDGGKKLGPLVSVEFWRGSERTVVRPLGDGGEIMAAAGAPSHPGRAHRDAARAASVLEGA